MCAGHPSSAGPMSSLIGFVSRMPPRLSVSNAGPKIRLESGERTAASDDPVPHQRGWRALGPQTPDRGQKQ